MNEPWPDEIRVEKGGGSLHIRFDSGERFALPAEMLRVLSPSAEVQGHAPEQRKTVFGKRHVRISDVQSVGNYAVRILFDDLHDTGLYSWTYLFKLGQDHETLWNGYLNDLSQKGFSRDP